MKPLFYLLVVAGLLSLPVRADHHSDLDHCKNASDKVLCTAHVLNEKLEHIIDDIHHLGGGGGGGIPLYKVIYFDEPGCTDPWAQVNLPKMLSTTAMDYAEKACKRLAETLANISDSNNTVESVKAGDQCYSVKFQRQEKQKSEADCMSRVGG